MAKCEKVKHPQVFRPRWFCCLPVFSYACLGALAPPGSQGCDGGSGQQETARSARLHAGASTAARSQGPGPLFWS